MLALLSASVTLYEDRGLRAPDFPATWTYPAGVYDVPIKLPTRHRLIVAVTATGELLHAALVEPGGDVRRATDDLKTLLHHDGAEVAHLPLVHL